MQRKYSDNFPLFLIGGVLALWLLVSSIFGNLFYGVIKTWFEQRTGMQESEVIARLTQVITPLLASGAVVWFLWTYIHREYEKMSLPVLKCSFDMNDTGCVHQNILARVMNMATGQVIGTKVSDWYRLRIDAESGNVSGCGARLLRVERDGILLFSGDTPPLNIVHSGVETDVTISEGVPQYADLLVVYDDNTADLCVPLNKRTLSADWKNMFTQAGEYRIKAAIISPNAKTALVDILFRWQLDRSSVEIKSCDQKR